MKSMKMNRKTKKLASNFVCIVTALSLVFLQTPVSYATAGADEAAQAVATQAEQATQADELAVQAADDDAPAASDAAKAGKADEVEAAKAADAKDAAPKADADAKSEAAEKPAAETTGTAKAEDAKAATDVKADAENVSGKEDSTKATAADEGAAKEDAAGKDSDKDADAKAAADEDAAKGQESDKDGDSAKVAKDEAAKPATQRVYTYEDKQLKVTATLDKASAITDDAELKVTAITAKSAGYNYDAYLAALNEDAGQADAYTADNTLLYDVAFLVKDDDGKLVEVQPESGAVKVQFEFKKDQLAKQLDAQEADDVQVVHLPLKDSAKADTTAEATDIAVTDVKVEKLDADVSVENGTLSLKTQEFSAFAIVTLVGDSSDYLKVTFQDQDGNKIDSLDPKKTFYLYATLKNYQPDEYNTRDYWNLREIDQSALRDGVVYDSNSLTDFYSNQTSPAGGTFSGKDVEIEFLASKYSDRIDNPNAWQNSRLDDNGYERYGIGDAMGEYVIKEVDTSDEGVVTVIFEKLPTYQYQLRLLDSSGAISSKKPANPYYLFAKYAGGNAESYLFTDEIQNWNSPVQDIVFTDWNGQNSKTILYSNVPLTNIALVSRDQNGNKPSMNDANGGYNGVVRYGDGSIVEGYSVSIEQEESVTLVTLREAAPAKVHVAFETSAGNPSTPSVGGDELYLFTVLHRPGKQDLFDYQPLDTAVPEKTYEVTTFSDASHKEQDVLKGGYSVESFVATAKNLSGNPLNDFYQAYHNNTNTHSWSQGDYDSATKTVLYGGVNSTLETSASAYSVEQDDFADADASLVLAKLPSIDTVLEVYDQDGTSPHDMTTEELGSYKFYAAAVLVEKGAAKDSEPVAWSIVQVDPANTGNHIEPISFYKFYAYGEDGGSADEIVAYDPTKYDLGGARGVSIYKTTNGNISTYKDLLANGDANPVDGFEWFGNDTLNVNGNPDAETSIKLRKSYDKVLQVKLDFNDEGRVLNDSDNLYLFIKVKHQSGADSYFFQGITSAEAGDITIPVPNWQDNNGDAKNDKFTGNESTIEVKLLKGKQGLNMNNAISGTDCSVVTEGSVAEGYTVHYDFTSDPKDAEENTVDSERTIYYTKVIELTKVNATNDYTFRSILGPAIGYGITADRLEQGSSDFQSNFAVNNYHDNGIGVNPDLSGGSSGALAIGNYVTYNSDAGTVASIDPDGKVFIGQSHSGDLLLYTDSADRVRDARDWVYTIVYSPAEVAGKIVEPSIVHMQKISAELAAHSANITPSKTTDKATIDTTDYPDDATIYVDADALDAVYGSFSGGTTLNIVKKENQTIVFNFKGMETVNVGQYVVTIYDSDGNVKWDEKNSEPNTGNAHGDANHQNTLVDELCKTIIWNLASATDVTIEQTAGTFLLPKSNSKTLVEKTSTGWIVSDGYVYNKGEWHFAWADLNQVDVAELNASKSIGGKVPTGTQKFEFSFEHWNKANNDWILLKDVKNDGSSVTWRTVNESDGKSELNDGWNVYKISEKRKSEGTLGEFALDENTYYAVVKYTTTENASGTTAVASLPVYYKTFNSAAFDANAKSAAAFMSGAVSSITFVNEEEKGNLELKKTVEGSEDTTTKFTFEIKVEQPAPTETDANAKKALSGVYKAEVATEGATGNPETVNVEFANGYGYIALTAGQTATIKGLPAGSTYTVKETKVGGKTLPSGGSVDQWSVKSVSVDEQNVSGVIGSGTIVKDKTSEVGFVNAFADNTKGSLRITKNATVNGEDPTDANKSAASGAFTFKVKGPGPEGQEQNVTIRLENGVSSTSTLDNLEPGEYTVEEINLPNNVTLAEGIENPQTVTVVAGNETGIPTAEFTNNFTWDEYEATGNVTLGGTKVIDSRAWTAEDEFAFSVTEVTDATGETAKANGYTDSATASLANAGMTSAAAGAEVGWSFPTINYTLDDLGTHYYKVVETSTNGDGITVDTDSYIVTVTVADETRDGELEITKSENYDSLAFTNAYSADGSFTITGVTKALTGRAAGENETFTFVVKETDAEWNVIPGKEPVATGTVSGTGAVTFNPISFRLDANTHDTGTHYYAVSEVGTDGGGLTYDKTVEKFSVEVKDDRKGNLTVNNQKDARVNLNKTFTNRYTANGKIQLKATKQLKGRGLTAEDEGKFTFELSGPKLGADGANGTITATNGEGGVAAFAEIAFTEEDLKDGNSYLDSKEFTYTIREVVPTDADKVKGVTYDTSEKTVKVTVSDPKHNGELSVIPTYPEDGATFTNTYDATGSVTLEGTKSITGRSFKAGDSATMKIEAITQGAPMPKVDGQVRDTVTVEPTSGTEVAFAFGEIAYSLSDIPEGKTSETFKYEVTEYAYTMQGVAEADSKSYTVEVTVSDSEAHDGTLKIEVSGNEAGLNFTNAYDATGSVTLSGAKSITGRDFKSGDTATMKIEAVTQGAPMPKVDGQVKDTVKIEPTSGAEITFAFGEIAYSLSDIPAGKTSKTFTYKVTESAYAMEGVAEKDSTEYEVSVTISDKGDGTLDVVASGDVTGLNFTNKYAASGSLTLGGTKTIDKREIAPDDTFGFEVKEGDRAVSHGVAEGTSVITYDAIKYTLADVGEHEYVVSETQCDAAGVTKSNATLTFKVKVSDNGDGTLKVETLKGESDNLSFENAYSATGELELSGKKVIENKPANASLAGYTFTVKEGDTTVATGESDANGNITFGKISYAEADAGTHTYVVTEDGAGTAKDGVTNTQDTVTVIVDVADNGKGQMTATTAEMSPAKIDAVNFTNAYAASGKTELEAKKVVKNDNWGSAEKFTFVLEPVNGAPMPADAVDGKKSVDITKDTEGLTAKFGEMTYTAAGTYKYTISEVNDGVDGVSYDTTSHEVEVVASDDGKGNLTFTTTYDGEDALLITNEYTAAEATLQATKEINDWGTAERFTFKLEAVGDAPLPEKDGEPVDTATATESSPTAIFGDVSFAKEGTYEYTITEVDDGADGVTYDITPHKVTVKVTKANDASNALTAKVTYDGNKENLTIVNSYASANAKLQATKSFNDWGKADSFEFVLTPVDGAPMPGDVASVAKTVTEENPTAMFGSIKYQRAGAYKYIISETPGTADGVSYDTKDHEVVVKVTKGEGNTLKTETTYDGEKSLTITNTYTAAKTHFEAKKSFDSWGKAESFTFELAAKTQGAPMPSGTTTIATATATEAKPLATFGDITFEKVGTYEYTITERNDGVDGVTYDAAEHNVKVVVSKADDATNALTAKVTYDGTDKLEITNTYQAATAQLEVTKKINVWGKESTFEFELAPVDGAPMPQDVEGVATAKATAASYTATFAPIAFEKQGDYRYNITEKPGTADWVTYDTTAHQVLVKVTKDSKTNALSAVATYDNKEKLTITNTYTAKGSITFEGVKKLENRALSAGQFGFSVSEGDVVVARVTHDADGKIAYPTVEYTLDDVGEHTYTVKETSKDGNGITVDKTTHTVTVEVSDNGDGTLKVVPSDNYKKLNFTNNYDANGTATLKVAKALAVGDKWPEGKTAEFTLAAVDGAPMPAADKRTVSLTAAGTAEFGEITYPLSSAGETYKYTITETAWTGWNASTNGVVNVTVEVGEDTTGTGELTTTVTYERGDTVTNTMKRTSASVKKVWNDADNQDGKRPASLTVALQADGKTVETVELSDANKWAATVENLPQYAGEKEISYTWAEEAVPDGYTLSGNKPDGTLTTLTNTHEVEKVEVGITKKWDDADNQDGKRPADITVNLFANGEKVKTQKVKANDQGEWTYTFTNLNKYYDNGKLVEYAVSEEGVEHYTLANIPLTGETIAVDAHGKVVLVNQHTVEKTKASAKKVWEDFGNKNKQRPESLTLALTANGTATDKTVVLSEGNGWQAELDGLDTYAKGEEITYAWTETDLPAGYTLSNMAKDGTVTTLTNAFTAVGKLTFTKTVSGGVTEEEADGALKFVVTKVDDDGKVLGYLDENGNLVDEKAELTISDGFVTEDGGQTYTKTFTDIAVGNYKVTETNTAVEGYRFNEDHSVTETKDAVSVTEGYEAKAELTDDYTEIGNLTFTKTVEGGVSKEEADGALVFEVTLKVDGKTKWLNAEGELQDERAKITLKDGFDVTEDADGVLVYTKTFEGVDAGTYTVTETNAAIEGYHFNEKHSIMDGKTTVSKDAAGAASLTDVYDAGTSIPLAGKKSYTDVVGNTLDMPAGMFEFTLVEVDAEGNALEGDAVCNQKVGNAADGTITFDAIDYKNAGTHYYQVSEVNGGETIDGITYSDTVYDVTVEVADDPDSGELVATVSPDKLSLDFANGYRAADVDVVLNAQKAYVDNKTGAKQDIKDDQFSFILMPADEASEDEDADSDADSTPVVYMAQVASDGTATFDAITFTADMLEGASQKEFNFDMSEVIPDTAEKVFQNGKETDWWMDGDTVYDGATHEVKVTVADDGSGQLKASVEYDKGKVDTVTGPTFTNKHVEANESLKFTKYYYGHDKVDFEEFSFVLEAVKDVNEKAGTYQVRGETELDVPEGGEIADDGVRPFTILTTISAEAFHDAAATQADVGFPAIRFVNDGTYYYVVYEGTIDYIEELAEDEQPIAEDSAKYLIRVDVKDGKVASTKYWLLYEGDVFEVNPGSGSDELAFYNNSTGVVDFDDSGSHGYTEDGSITSVYPRAKKLVNGETLAIAKNQFTFELTDEDGEVLATATNDDNGDVAFPKLEFDEPGVYTYQIREVVPPKSEQLPGVTYDNNVTTLTVDVVRESMPNDTGNGTVYALEASTAYAGPNQPEDLSADYAIFNNLMEGIDVRVQKLDAATGDGLAGCEYALWMRTSDGDVCLATAESGADGWITFEHADILPGYKYYFKEVSTPSGYVLDPYRSDFFELSYDKASGEYSLVSAE